MGSLIALVMLLWMQFNIVPIFCSSHCQLPIFDNVSFFAEYIYLTVSYEGPLYLCQIQSHKNIGPIHMSQLTVLSKSCKNRWKYKEKNVT